jgi:hypothetical protein
MCAQAEEQQRRKEEYAAELRSQIQAHEEARRREREHGRRPEEPATGTEPQARLAPGHHVAAPQREDAPRADGWQTHEERRGQPAASSVPILPRAEVDAAADWQQQEEALERQLACRRDLGEQRQDQERWPAQGAQLAPHQTSHAMSEKDLLIAAMESGAGGLKRRESAAAAPVTGAAGCGDPGRSDAAGKRPAPSRVLPRAVTLPPVFGVDEPEDPRKEAEQARKAAEFKSALEEQIAARQQAKEQEAAR